MELLPQFPVFMTDFWFFRPERPRIPTAASTAWHGMAQRSKAQWHSTECHGMAQHGIARHSKAQNGTAWHRMVQHGTEWHSMAQHGIYSDCNHNKTKKYPVLHPVLQVPPALHIVSFLLTEQRLQQLLRVLFKFTAG